VVNCFLCSKGLCLGSSPPCYPPREIWIKICHWCGYILFPSCDYWRDKCYFGPALVNISPAVPSSSIYYLSVSAITIPYSTPKEWHLHRRGLLGWISEKKTLHIELPPAWKRIAWTHGHSPLSNECPCMIDYVRHHSYNSLLKTCPATLPPFTTISKPLTFPHLVQWLFAKYKPMVKSIHL